MTLKSRFQLFIYVNILMTLLYIAIDYFSWMQIRDDLQPLYDLTRTGTFSMIYANVYYTVLFRQVQIVGNGFSQGSYLPNLPLFFFIATMIINIFLVFRMTKESSTKS